jgi:hypothetical protein
MGVDDRTDECTLVYRLVYKNGLKKTLASNCN